jgi:hypothetical protein
MLIYWVGTYITKNTEALLIASKEVNSEKTKYMVMSLDQNAGQNGNMQIGNKSFETVEQFKYLGTTLTYKNSIHEEIKSRLKSGSACCHTLQNLLSSSSLSKKVKIKIYRTIIFFFQVIHSVVYFEQVHFIWSVNYTSMS